MDHDCKDYQVDSCQVDDMSDSAMAAPTQHDHQPNSSSSSPPRKTANTVDDDQQKPDEEDDTDAILASLESEINDLDDNPTLQPHNAGAHGHSSTTTAVTPITTLSNDDETLRFTTEHRNAVLHFFHADFHRCAVMDRHIESIIAARALGGSHDGEENSAVAWGRVNVNDIPFLVERMKVRVLPCVVGFRDGVVVGRVVGFEGLVWDLQKKSGNGETGWDVTRALEERLVEWGVIKKGYVRLVADDVSDDDEDAGKDGRRNGNIRDRMRRPGEEEDDDDEWD